MFGNAGQATLAVNPLLSASAVIKIKFMNKKEREIVFNKYEGRCAYCGYELQKGWHVDHIIPLQRNESDLNISRYNKIRGENSLHNYFPACRQCNIWKSTYSIEQFRAEVASQLAKVNRYSCNYRNAKRFGLVAEVQKEIVFHFELTDSSCT